MIRIMAGAGNQHHFLVPKAVAQLDKYSKMAADLFDGRIDSANS